MIMVIEEIHFGLFNFAVGLPLFADSDSFAAVCALVGLKGFDDWLVWGECFIIHCQPAVRVQVDVALQLSHIYANLV